VIIKKINLKYIFAKNLNNNMMKKTILLLVSIASLSLTSCKKESSSENNESLQQPVVDETFNVILDVIIKKDDDIALFYTTDGSVDFSKNVPIWQGVKGSDTQQQIVFKLPKDVKPNEFRFDLGRNPLQEDIYFKKVTFSYIGKSREIACPELVDFFRANDNYCTFDHLTGLVKVKPSPNGERFFPSIYPHELKLKPEIEKLY
jgi:hypothetical protein